MIVFDIPRGQVRAVQRAMAREAAKLRQDAIATETVPSIRALFMAEADGLEDLVTKLDDATARWDNVISGQQ